MTRADPQQPGLHELIADFARFGATAEGGVCRLSGTPEDKAARDRFTEEVQRRGFRLDIDPIGNMFGTAVLAPQTRQAIIVGSHLDSQPTGGRFDGTYGVVAGLVAAAEIAARAAREPGRAKRNLIVANWTNEEGARFQPSLTGSSVYAGLLPLDKALALADGSGVTLGEALASIGYRGAAAPPFTPLRYVELHIEQGPQLEQAGRQIGLVAGAWATRKLSIVFVGDPSHTGPTPMPRRRDALRAAAAGIAALHDIIADGAHASAARMTVYPNSPNVVASRVQVWFEIRHAVQAVADRLADNFLARLEADCAPLSVSIEIAVDESRQAASLDAAGLELIESVVRDLGFSPMIMQTITGHDALALQKCMPASLIFVPSRDGLSHNPREYTDPEALANGLAVLTETLWRLVTAP